MDVLNLYEDPYIANILAFDNTKEQLERDYWGKWVVFSSMKLFGVYDSVDEAEYAVTAANPAIRDHFLAKVGQRATVVLSHGG